MKYIRLIKSGTGASLTFTNFEFSTENTTADLSEATMGVQADLKGLKLVSCEVLDSSGFSLGRTSSLKIKEASLSCTLIDEALENGDTTVSVDNLNNTDNLRGTIGNGQWTYEYLKDGMEIKIYGDCSVYFSGKTSDYSADCSADITLVTSPGFTEEMKTMIEQGDE